MSFIWSQQALDLLSRFYVQEGLTAAETASAIGQLLGAEISRNAVLGKAQRMGWSKPAPERPPPRPANVRPPNARFNASPCWLARPRMMKPRPMPPLREVSTPFAAKVWTERGPGECAWPVGEPETPDRQRSCCAPTGGATYCTAHAALRVLPASAMSDKDRAAILEIARRAA